MRHSRAMLGIGPQRQQVATRPGTIRPFVVGLLWPVSHQPTGVLDGDKQPSVEASIAKHSIEALVMPVLPWTTRFNEGGVNVVCTQPVRDLLCDELRTLVTFYILQRAALREQPLAHLDAIPRRDRAGAVNGQPFAGVLIQHRQAFQPAPSGGFVMDNIVAPDMVGMRCLGRHSRVRPDGAPLARFLDHLESLALPKAAHRFTTDGPLLGLQQGKNL
jgi:hypothetical protein